MEVVTETVHRETDGTLRRVGEAYTCSYEEARRRRRRGFVTFVGAPEKRGAPEDKAESGPPENKNTDARERLEEKTREDLIRVAQSVDISEDSIDGTGARGYVKKSDLIRAILARSSQAAA